MTLSIYMNPFLVHRGYAVKQHKNPIYNIIVHENAVNFNTIAKIFHFLLKLLTSGGGYAIMTTQNSILREGVASVYNVTSQHTG